MMATAIQKGARPRRAWGLILLQVAFPILAILDVVLFEWLRRLHEWPVWEWAWVVGPTIAGLLYLYTGSRNLEDPKLRRRVVDFLLLKVWRLLAVCVVLGLAAGLLTWLLFRFYASVFDPITFEEFVRQLSKRRERDPAAIREFAKDWEEKEIEWDCVVIEAARGESAYKIGVTRDASRKDRAYASFSDPDAFRPSLEGKTRIRGTIRKVDKLGIRLTDCRFAESRD
ncbi:MAG: hypothetical protein HQ567_01355 [Candidatus Nealsonbacteria bacterium]|nr:hypothetical protein [Candidatus Nealsonbacteria bacterium]